MIELCGFNDIEAAMFKLLHEGRSDSYIEDELGLSKPTREAMEEAIAAKLSIGIFTCINRTMDLYEK